MVGMILMPPAKPQNEVIDENVVRAISADKGEPQWMLDMRLRGFKAFLEKPMPDWGVDLSGFNADDFKYYVKPIDKQAKSWDELT